MDTRASMPVSGAYGQAHVDRQMPRVPAHDLHHAGPLVGLHGVGQLVDALDGRVGGGVKADGVVGAADVVVDGGGHAHGVDPRGAELLGAPEGAVAADGDDAVDARVLAGADRLLDALVRGELLAAGGVEDGAAPVGKAVDGTGVHLEGVPLDEAVVAPVDTHGGNALLKTGADRGADGRVHAGRVAAAGQDTDTSYDLIHCVLPMPSV